MKAEYVPVRDLFGSRRGVKFEVPPYQRGYEWEQKHWRDLWTDINKIGEQVDQHYLGNIILLERTPSQLYEIVDGQQRMVTLSLLMMAIRDAPNYTREDDIRLRDVLESNRGATTEEKLKLSDPVANEQFEQIWRGDYDDAQGRVRNAYDFYADRVEDFTSDQLDEIIDKTCRDLRVVETVATDTSLAYTIFQSQNERGKEVSPQILAKARIYGAAEDIEDTEKANRVTGRWDQIYKLLEDNLGGPRFQRRLRVRRPMTQIIINSEVPTPRQIDKNELYRNFETVLNNYDDVDDFVQWFHEQTDIYLQLSSNSYHVDGHDIPNDAIRHLQYLNAASTHSEVLSLAIYNNIEDEVLLRENFRLASILAMRMELSSTSSADTRDAIYGTAAEVRVTEDQNEIRQTIRDCIKEYTPTDGEMEEYLKANSMNIRGSWNFRTLLKLVSIEEERRGPWKMELDNLHIEHIAPRNTYGNPDYFEWRANLNDEEYQEQKDKLGNLTLLTDSDHASLDETSFADKKKTYRDSDVKIAEEISNCDEWTSEMINRRTQRLSEELINRWSI